MTANAWLLGLALAALAVVALVLKGRFQAFREAFLTRGGLHIAVWGLLIAGALALRGSGPRSVLWVVPMIGVVGGVAFYILERSGWLAQRLRRRSLRRIRDRTPVGSAAPTDRATYGPNAEQVQRFLSALRTLSAVDWQRILSLGEATIRRDADDNRVLDGLGRETERMQASEWLTQIIHHRGPRESHADGPHLIDTPQYHASRKALEAIVVSDLLSPRQFADLYAPFEPFIPAKSIGLRHLSPSQRTKGQIPAP
jgi:hypothetical protein